MRWYVFLTNKINATESEFSLKTAKTEFDYKNLHLSWKIPEPSNGQTEARLYSFSKTFYLSHMDFRLDLF